MGHATSAFEINQIDISKLDFSSFKYCCCVSHRYDPYHSLSLSHMKTQLLHGTPNHATPPHIIWRTWAPMVSNLKPFWIHTCDCMFGHCDLAVSFTYVSCFRFEVKQCDTKMRSSLPVWTQMQSQGSSSWSTSPAAGSAALDGGKILEQSSCLVHSSLDTSSARDCNPKSCAPLWRMWSPAKQLGTLHQLT